MARGKDLAGLAALGALGMMLSKGKKGADRDTDTGVDVQPSYAARDPLEAANSSQEAMDIRDSLTRGAPGTSETVTPSRKPTTSRARATAPVRSMAKARPRLNTSGVTDTDLTGGAESPDQTGGRGVGSRGSLGSKLVQGYGGRRFHPEYDEDLLAGRARDRALNAQIGAFDQNSATAYKKGGAVKKMASGGMASSASKRADGIAQKGKTKGRMC